jgi:hypothetical protein
MSIQPNRLHVSKTATQQLQQVTREPVAIDPLHYQAQLQELRDSRGSRSNYLASGEKLMPLPLALPLPGEDSPCCRGPRSHAHL